MNWLHWRSLQRRARRALAVGGVAMAIAGNGAAIEALPSGTVQAATADQWERNIAPPQPPRVGSARDEPTDRRDDTLVCVGLGAMLAGGNARFFGASGEGKLRVRRDRHLFAAHLAGNYSRSAGNGGRVSTTIENVQARAQYDRSVAKTWAAFLAGQARRDRFQGLDLRLQLQPGVGYNIVDRKAERFWAEAGYELLFDLRRPEATLLASGDGPAENSGEVLQRLPTTRALHSARAFMGYSTEVNDAVSIAGEVEYLASLSRSELFRINGIAVLRAKLNGAWSLGATFSASYDNMPLPEKQSLDTASLLNVVYSF